MYNSLNFSNSKQVCLLTWNPDQWPLFWTQQFHPKFWGLGPLASESLASGLIRGQVTFKKYGGLRVWTIIRYIVSLWCPNLYWPNVSCFKPCQQYEIETSCLLLNSKEISQFGPKYPPIAHSHFVCVCVDSGDFWHQLRLISQRIGSKIESDGSVSNLLS